ncbi:MAG: DUF2336 domain-containing protein [Robiginitomaculum sp.]|nr:DUF2336 domain-containing protein [Robiginitomaculum sp.]
MTDLSAALSMTQLAKLAQSSNPKKRDQLFLALGSLCAVKPMESLDEAAISEIMFLLNKKAADNVKQQAANLLCAKEWTPRKLVLSWANDEPQIANPVLLKSPVLTDDDLVLIIKNSSLFHRLAIAGRHEIVESVTNALIIFDEPEVIITMAANSTAKMSMETFASCVRISRRHDKLRLFLTDRADLPRSLIPSLFAYSNQEERKLITKQFGVDADNFSAVVRQAVLDKPRAEKTTTISDDPELKIARLVSKLAKANKLSPSLVIRATVEGKTLLFEHAISHLADVPVEHFRSAMQRGPSIALALACNAAKLERAVFPSLHRNLNDLGYFHETLSGEIAAKSVKAFTGHSTAAAAVSLRLMAGAN